MLHRLFLLIVVLSATLAATWRPHQVLAQTLDPSSVVTHTGSGAIDVPASETLTVWQPPVTAAATFTLDAPATPLEQHIFKNLAGDRDSSMVVAAGAGQTIDGEARVPVPQGGCLRLMYIGNSAWIIISWYW